ncbi:MAG: Gfo/Idh/MocA family oxidoreductase [Ruminococcaceae bacterium]|nr:Gfo/Idh/MocA family oxidoreductase [Oscillospiraceae bacterium]
MDKKTLILIGGGNRGNTYVNIGKSIGKFKLIAIAEPVKERREYIAKNHDVPENMCFDSWEPLLALGKIADGAIIATMDRDHYGPAMKAINLGYDLLLEKPVSHDIRECEEIRRAAADKGVNVLVCHVLRYTPFFLALKALLDGGKVGKVMNIQHTEGVGNVHQSHSFVRGNWSNSERASFMLLQKSCHDLDILQWLIGKECRRVQSFGHLSFFTRENAPDGATEHCFDGCPHLDTCVYSAKKLYFEREDGNWFKGSATQMHSRPDDATVAHALATTNYGKCVFMCDNDVVDHQVVNMEFEDDIIVSFTMSAFNLGGRKIRIMGTKGELVGDMNSPDLIFNDLITQQTETISIADVAIGDSIVSGHGGGDPGIMNSFYDVLCGSKDETLSNINISVKNHKIAFAAERSRLEGRVVSIDEMN